MTMNGAMAIILRYLTEISSFRDQPRQSDWSDSVYDRNDVQTIYILAIYD